MFLNRTFVIGSTSKLRCPLPDGCSFERIYEGLKEKNFGSIFCQIYNNEFEFKFNDSKFEPNVTYESCNDYFGERKLNFQLIALRWPSSNKLAILEPKFNMTNLQRYFDLFQCYIFKLINAKGFDVNILDSHFFNNLSITTVDLINCRLDFYYNKSKLQSCQDFIKSNVTIIRSIFQILTKTKWEVTTLKIENFEYKQTICPLTFINASFDILELVFLENTFMKNSMIIFSNDTINREINSFIKKIIVE